MAPRTCVRPFGRNFTVICRYVRKEQQYRTYLLVIYASLHYMYNCEHMIYGVGCVQHISTAEPCDGCLDTNFGGIEFLPATFYCVMRED